MAHHTVVFAPFGKAVTVEAGTRLLDAAAKAHIALESPCGGDGICGRCKLIVKKGDVRMNATGLLTRDEIRQGVVLACQTYVHGDLQIEIPEESRAQERIVIDKDAERFRAERPGIKKRDFKKSPIVSKILVKLDPPTLDNNIADCQRLQAKVEKLTGISSMQTGLKIIQRMPEILRENDFTVTVVVGWRRGVAEIMDIEGGDTSGDNFMAIVDVGTSTVIVHLVDVVEMKTIDTQACFNSQATYGREVTARMISAEKHGPKHLQGLLVEDINRLIAALATKNNIPLKDITAAVCAGNTAMMHFLLGIPTENIRRDPFIAATVEPPPFRAAEVGIKINPRGLLFAVPGIGGWVGGDLTAGILATGLHGMDEIGMLIDIGTNGEIILGNKEWLIACSASAGPALEGAGVECGMMAHTGAIEKVYLKDGRIKYQVIGDGLPDGICGSGIIDMIAVLLEKGVIDRGGKFIEGSHSAVSFEDGRGKFTIATKNESLKGREIYIQQDDIDNVITAKAAIFAAAKIMLERLDMEFSAVKRLFVAGGFGSYINLKNAIAIGLFPDMPISNIFYVGNTSIWGAKLAAFSKEARQILRQITGKTTYYDLMGTGDYVEQFRQAMFLPHTDIELFPSVMAKQAQAPRQKTSGEVKP